MYMEESHLEWLRSPAEPGKGFQVVSHCHSMTPWMIPYSPLSMMETLRMRPWEFGGGEEGGEEGKVLQSQYAPCVDCELG